MRKATTAAALLATIALAACGGGGDDTSASPGTSSLATIHVASGDGLLIENAQVDAGIGTTTTPSIASSFTHTTCTVDVYVPPGAATSATPLPVIYSPDAQYLFDDIVATVQHEGIAAIVVSVAYVDDAERATDYLLPGALAYDQFLTRELMPAIEAQYRIDPTRRMLIGYSYSGVFSVLAMLYDDPAHRLFSSVVSADGSIGPTRATSIRWPGRCSPRPARRRSTCT